MRAGAINSVSVNPDMIEHTRGVIARVEEDLGMHSPSS